MIVHVRNVIPSTLKKKDPTVFNEFVYSAILPLIPKNCHSPLPTIESTVHKSSNAKGVLTLESYSVKKMANLALQVTNFVSRNSIYVDAQLYFISDHKYLNRHETNCTLNIKRDPHHCFFFLTGKISIYFKSFVVILDNLFSIHQKKPVGFYFQKTINLH